MDLNHRPLGYEPNELPDCSTPQLDSNAGCEGRQTSHQGTAAVDTTGNRKLPLRKAFRGGRSLGSKASRKPADRTTRTQCA
jgi:hypothetical protein